MTSERLVEVDCFDKLIISGISVLQPVCLNDLPVELEGSVEEVHQCSS